MVKLDQEAENKTNIDQSILNFLYRDFRIEPKFKSKALQFGNFTKFCQDFPHVVPVEEYARSILSSKHGVSVRTMIRLLARFSGVDNATQRKVIGLLLSNDKFVQPYVAFKHNKLEDSYELDVDASLLFLKSGSTVISHSIDQKNACYG